MTTAEVARQGATNKKRSWTRKQKRQLLLAGLFLLPSLIGIGLYMIYSTGFGAYVSFTDYRGIILPDKTTFSWVGLENYARVLKDPAFWSAFRWSLMFCLVLTPLQLGLGLLIAIGLNRHFFGQKAARVSYYVPSMMSWVVAAMLFTNLLDLRHGIVNQLLEGVGLEPVPFLDWNNPKMVFWGVCIVSTWKNFGGTMLLYLASLQDIPHQLYDAAKVDGASRVQRFRNVTLPTIKPITLFVLIGAVLGNINIFTPIYIWIGGRTDLVTERRAGGIGTIPIFTYRQAFQKFEYGYGAAVSWIMFFVLLALTYFQFRYMTRGRQGEEEVA